MCLKCVCVWTGVFECVNVCVRLFGMCLLYVRVSWGVFVCVYECWVVAGIVSV